MKIGVIGLGLIGMAVSQILKASGSNVIAIDIDKNNALKYVITRL